MNWTEEQISLLKRLRSEGKKAREIATILGGGVTRNAVIGKVNRMKLAANRNALAESSVGSKAAPPKMLTPKKQAPKKSTPKKPAPKKPAPKKSAPKKQEPKKPAPKKLAPEKQEPKKPVASKVAPKSPPPPRKPVRNAAVPPPPPPPTAEPLLEPEESREPVSPPLIQELDVDEDVKGASLFGEGGCKWPIGHPGEENFHFCGERRHETLPYCKNHAQEAYQMADRRRGRNS